MATHEVAMRALTRNTRWVVLDIETTPSDDGQHVVSIGINHWRMDPTTEQPTPSPVEWFVDPGVPIENTRFHHITAKTLTDNRAEPFACYIDTLNDILTPRPGEKVVLVAHYARFDIGVLHLVSTPGPGRASLMSRCWTPGGWLAGSTSPPATTSCRRCSPATGCSSPTITMPRRTHPTPPNCCASSSGTPSARE